RQVRGRSPEEICGSSADPPGTTIAPRSTDPVDAAATSWRDGPRQLEPPSERLQVLDQVGLLRRRQMQSEPRIVVLDDREKIGRAAVVEVRRVLQGAAQPRRGGLVRGGRPRRDRGAG